MSSTFDAYERTMRIGFDAKRLFHNYTGLGNYSRSLIHGLNEYHSELSCVLFSPDIDKSQFQKEFTRENDFVSRSGWNKSIWRSISQENDWIKQDIAIFHGLSHELPIIKRTKVQRVVTIHDLIHRTYPQDHKWFDRMIYDAKIKSALNQADKIICVSDSTKNDLLNEWKEYETKTEVVYQSVNRHFEESISQRELLRIKEKYALPDKYCLHVSSLRPRKNLMLIIEAMSLLDPKERLSLIVIGGDSNNYKKHLLKKIKEKNLEYWIHFKSVEWSDLKYFYNLAHYSIYPSFYEGFGIPVIESLFCDCPVIASNRSSIPEAGGTAAIYIDPAHPSQLAEAMRLLENGETRKELMQKGRKHREKFTLKAFSDSMKNVYKSLKSS